MRKCTVATVLFISSLVCSTLDAKTLHAHHKLNKIYVDARSVKLERGSIIIHTSYGPFKVKTLRSDKRGVFVFEKELSKLRYMTKAVYQCRYCPKIFWSQGQRDKHEPKCPLNPNN